MTTEIAPRESTELATTINREHAQVLASATNMVQFAVNCGDLLLQVRESVPHGGWATWVEEHFDGSDWVARKYMQLAREEKANRGRITEMGSIYAALRSIATPRPQIEAPAPPKLDPESAAGRMAAAAKALSRGDDDDGGLVVDAEAIEIAPTGVEERRWNTALKHMDDVRRCMSEAVNPDITSDATSQALQEASIAARQAAIDLEQMANAARRRAA